VPERLNSYLLTWSGTPEFTVAGILHGESEASSVARLD